MAVVNKMWIGLAFASTLLPLLWILVWVCAFGNNCIRAGNITDSVLWNWHPFLMTLAFTFLVANGMLAWRGLPFSHTNRKIVHAFLNSCAVITSALGLWVVHGWKERIGDNHFYNAHNWLGMFSLVALWSQWLGGFFLGVMPMPASFKASAAPLHRFWGRFVYISGIATILTGILNHEMFLLARYGAFDQTVDFGNVFVLVGLLSSFLVLHNLEREYMPFPVDYPPVKGMASSHPAHLTEAAGVASVPTTARGTPEVISMRPSAAPGVY